MPNPPDQFVELEAANAWNYTLAEWDRESLVNKARCMAHTLYKNMREGYIYDNSDGGKGDENERRHAAVMKAME